jgi:protoporphyrin/coproporphyrin ferrochelatase
VTDLVGILVMAYGTASGPEDVERYYTDIRGGRPPSPQHLEELKARYAAVGNRFPLLEITRQQAVGLEAELNRRGSERFRAYVGMKHSSPFILDGLARMRRDGIGRAVGLVMAPHWSGMSVEGYVERVEKAVAEEGGPEFTFIRHWYDHPAFVRFLASRVLDALDLLPQREDGAVVFTAHSLPTRAVEGGSLRCKMCFACEVACRYVQQMRRTADLVAGRIGLETYQTAWQSAGRTADQWWGPSLDQVVLRLAGSGHQAMVVCSAGFVSDHLEILYDLDVEARLLAERAGMAFARTEMPNADPRFLSVLGDVVFDHLRTGAGGEIK